LKIFKAYVKYLIILYVNSYYRVKFKLSKNKKRVLLYTDSRGFLVDCFLCNKTPRKSYIDMLSKEFKIDYQLCTKKHTTILDFLEYIDNQDISKYSSIVLHLGIVDFSPRPLSQLSMVYDNKNEIVNKIFPKEHMIPNYYEDIYQGEKTFSLYNLDFFENIILKKVNEISKQTKIVWLGLNNVDVNWNGNYLKTRPLNINNILNYQNKILEYLDENETNIKYIDIDEIKDFNLKEHTLDNMHLSEDGFRLFYKILLEELK